VSFQRRCVKREWGDSVGARLTELGRHRNCAAFRTHNRRWEPLPGTGAIEEMADVVVTLLTPYLQPHS
jgi:hypothetical protein